jgi:hypothetical protein
MTTMDGHHSKAARASPIYLDYNATIQIVAEVTRQLQSLASSAELVL